MTPNVQSPSPIYSSFFTLGRKSIVRQTKDVMDVSSKIFACLDQVKAALGKGVADDAARIELEKYFIQFLVMGIEAEFTPESAQQFLIDLCADMDPYENDLEDEAEVERIPLADVQRASINSECASS